MYRTAIIGCGRIGSLFEDDPLRGKPCTHAGALARIPEADLVSACDIDEERLRAFGKRYGVDRLYADYREMLEREELDILIVSSWTPTHPEIVLKAAEKKIRGVLCEKPIALHSGEGLRMVEACFSSGARLVINHERRFDGRYQAARRLLSGGALGEPRTIAGIVISGKGSGGNLRRAAPGEDNPLIHDGTHILDIMMFLAGEIEAVSGSVKRRSVPGRRHETVTSLLRFGGGMEGWVECDSDRDYFHFEVDVKGSEGRIRIGNGFEHLYLGEPSRLYEGYLDLAEQDFPLHGAMESPWIGAVREVMACIEEERESLSGGLEALKSLRVIESIYLSSERGGAWIDVEHPGAKGRPSRLRPPIPPQYNKARVRQDRGEVA